eukprot:COSAG01_NODE_1921_length_8901_cov_18.211770_4_plen_88_part_00
MCAAAAAGAGGPESAIATPPQQPPPDDGAPNRFLFRRHMQEKEREIARLRARLRRYEQPLGSNGSTAHEAHAADDTEWSISVAIDVL